MPAPFIHLRARSAYSLLQSAVQVKNLVKLAAKHEMPALGLTDANNLFGALEFSEAAAEVGIQPIVGVALNVRGEGGADGVLALLAQSAVGYSNLMRLSTAAFLDSESNDDPYVPLSRVCELSEGLIALTGGGEGVLATLLAEGKGDVAAATLKTLEASFANRLYIELQRHAERIEADTEGALIELAYAHSLPLVATNDVRFAERKGHASHDALICIASSSYLGEEDRPRVTQEHYFKSAAEMGALFSDLPEALASTSEIAKRCAVRVEKRKPILPRFDTKRGRDEAAELKAQAEAGLKERLKALGDRRAAPVEDYEKRLAFELQVITQMQFPGYFLIVSDFIKWAKLNGIPVGPGRGSGAGSVVAWALTITDLDPLRWGLLFERFLNPERVSMPDFDIDFCQERRGEVIDYVKNKYGEDRVAHIITFGTLQARAVVRDVGRVMQLPFGQVDKFAKLIPANPANPVTLAQALEDDKLKEMRRNEPEIRALTETALELEGLYRNASTHAAGIVIGDRPLIELVPLYRDPRAHLPATQFNMKWVEAAGLVKFDFLGLKTLTVIDRAVKSIHERGIELDLDALGFDDEKTYELMQSGLTFGVFQLEGQGMRDTLRKVKPTCLEDVIALISLYRPGPMKNIDHFANVKHGREKPDYLHDTLKPILEETYGVIVYQEQVMQIAQVLSGYSLGEADLLRRAMGKKQPAEMAKQKSRFIDGAKDKGVNENLASHIFDLVEEFAGYGFNKSHAAAYAVIAYQTGYLKAHYPVDFVAASMSLELSNSEKLASFYQDARRIGAKVLPPDLNASEADFSVKPTEDGDLAVRYALGAVRNVALGAMEALVAERSVNGPFKALYDFSERLDSKAVNKRQLENLAKAGAFDTIEPDRARALASCEIISAYAQRVAEERASAQTSLFGSDEPSARPAFPKAPAWSSQDRLDAERESVGFYLSGHPLSDFFLDNGERYRTYAEILDEGETEPRSYPMAGVIRRIQYKPAMSGGTLAFIGVSDPTGDFEAMIVPEQVPVARDIIEAGKAFVFRGRVRWKEGDLKLYADTFEVVEAAEARTVEDLRVILKEGAPIELLAQTISALPKPAAGEARPLRLILRLTDGREIELKAKMMVSGAPAARAALKAARGVERVI